MFELYLKERIQRCQKQTHLDTIDGKIRSSGKRV